MQKFCGAPKVQATLDAISATLYQRARTLLEEDTQRTLEMDLPAANLLIPRQNVDSGFRRSILIDGEREQEERLRAEVDAKEK